MIRGTLIPNAAGFTETPLTPAQLDHINAQCAALHAHVYAQLRDAGDDHNKAGRLASGMADEYRRRLTLEAERDARHEQARKALGRTDIDATIV